LAFSGPAQTAGSRAAQRSRPARSTLDAVPSNTQSTWRFEGAERPLKRFSANLKRSARTAAPGNGPAPGPTSEEAAHGGPAVGGSLPIPLMRSFGVFPPETHFSPASTETHVITRSKDPKEVRT
jgi:hypothetical protein